MKKIQEISVLLHQLTEKQPFAETKDVLRVYEINLTKELFEFLRDLDSKVAGLPEFKMHVALDVGDEIDFNNSLDLYVDSECTVRIDKPNNERIYFLTAKGLSEFLSKPNALEKIDVVYSSIIKETFESYSTLFQSFEGYNRDFIKRDKISLIKYVKPLNSTAQLYLPDDLTKWLTKNNFYESCIDSWAKASILNVLYSLGFEFSISDGVISLEIIGDRRKKLIYSLDLTPTREFFHVINEIAIWIYIEANDVDSRHTIFNYELSKIIGDQLDIATNNLHLDAFKLAFENSKLVYRYHLVNSSKELNKTLTELNKSLFDYISKIRQNTIDLINTLWRDFATAFGIVVLNYTLKKEDLSVDYFKFFGFGLCTYLLISFFLSSKVNFWFYRNLKRNLNEWRPKIYGYISDHDFNLYTLNPLKRAQNNYLFTFWVVLSLYAVMIIAILHFILKIDLLSFFR